MPVAWILVLLWGGKEPLSSKGINILDFKYIFFRPKSYAKCTQMKGGSFNINSGDVFAFVYGGPCVEIIPE